MRSTHATSGPKFVGGLRRPANGQRKSGDLAARSSAAGSTDGPSWHGSGRICTRRHRRGLSEHGQVPRLERVPTLATLTALAALAALAALGACKGGDRGPSQAAYGHTEPQRGGVLRISMPTATDTLDPAIAYDETSLYAVYHIYDTLVGYGPALGDEPARLVPQLAESWSISPDGRTYSFTLRPDLRYSDGQPCVAGDFKYALERVLTSPRSPFKQFLSNVVGATEVIDGKARNLAGVTILDDRRLTIQLIEPDGAFGNVLAMAFATPLPARHVEAVGDELRSRPLGTGPFAVASWDEGRKLALVRNPHYWDQPLPYLDELIIYTNLPRDTAFLKFEAGELDTVARMSEADFVWLATRPDWQPYLDTIPMMSTIGARMNCRQKPFDDARVRQAINYAVNKRNVRKILSGLAEIAHGILPPGMLGHDPTIEPYPHDPERARALLAEAGYPDGFSIKYATFPDGPNVRVAQSIQADLEAVGIDMQIQLMSWPALIATAGSPDGVPFSYYAWLMDYPDPSNFIDTNFHSRMIASENSNNTAFYDNPTLDRLIDQANREVDPARRRAMYEEMDRILHDEAPWLWLFHLTHDEVRQPYVAGYKPHPVLIRSYRETWLDLPADHPLVRAGKSAGGKR